MSENHDFMIPPHSVEIIETHMIIAPSIFSVPSVQRHVGQTTPIETMGALRKEKDSWRPS